MAFKTSLWSADGDRLHAHDQIASDSEKRLENWIAADLSLLGEDLLLLGRQLRTTGGPLDLLAIDADGVLVIAELKRHRTPREVVAQVLDYASWVRGQSPRDFDELCRKAHGRPLSDYFRSHFKSDLPENACKLHRMLIVAAELDESSERIIRYLQDEHEIDINAVFFSVYQVEGKEVLVRAWLADPEETQERAERHERLPWTGIWFVNNGIDDNPRNTRNWEWCRKYGFVSAGGNERYWQPLYKLNIGDKIAVYQKKHGYVGVGTVTRPAVPANEFKMNDGNPLQKTFPGAFANQNVVCKLRDAATLEFLRREFGI
jgi:hypothetical protein